MGHFFLVWDRPDGSGGSWRLQQGNNEPIRNLAMRHARSIVSSGVSNFRLRHPNGYEEKLDVKPASTKFDLSHIINHRGW
ncbi:MAG: hypothetical protein ABL899_01015 [Nitrospira sp.]